MFKTHLYYYELEALIADSIEAGYVKKPKFQTLYFDQIEIFEKDFDLLFVK